MAATERLRLRQRPLVRAIRDAIALLRRKRRRRSALAVAAQASPALKALTAAAMALPGLGPAPSHAAPGDLGTFSYGHYTESARDLYGIKSAYKPIQVDSLFGSAHVTLADRWKLDFNFTQDTWGGATPMATAPLAWGGNQYGQTLTGATPYLALTSAYVDADLNPYGPYSSGTLNAIRKDTRLAHTLSTASPETRQQGDLHVTREWDDFALTAGAGASIENDYHSYFGDLGGRWDLNRKLTSLTLGLSYTNDSTYAQLDPGAFSYFSIDAYKNQIKNIPDPNSANVRHILEGTRQDWGTRLGLSQILTKDAFIETGLGFRRSTGYLGNPYKTVEFAFVDPSQTPDTTSLPGVSLYAATTGAVMEKRPEERNQWTWDMRYVQYVEPLDAALHLGYRFYSDDWGIDSHTFDVDWGQPLGGGWTVTPHFRYYSQSEADFYQPYFIYRQAAPLDPVSGKVNANRLPVDAYSSDQRLSGYGAVSGGVTVAKAIGKAITLEAAFEYYSHAGNLKLGGGGEPSYADFGYYQWNAGLKVDLSAPSLFDTGGDEHAHHHHHGGHGGHGGAPAGVMFGHMLHEAGQVMVGYRYMYNLQRGNMLHGSDKASDGQIVANGCGNIQCREASQDMSMHMHMLDLMYAPTDWLNLMLMPQFVSMEMTLRTLDGAPPPSGQHNHTRPTHTTGGVGDIGMYALVKLLDQPGHHVHAGIGISAPTGSVKEKMHGNDLIHYGMQLGSGTWDFKPSLTYLGDAGDWNWGAQLSGTKRLEDKNEVGFTFGDIFQSTAWGGYALTDWLNATVRGVYTLQGSIHGEYNQPHSETGPMDFPNSYGGHYWDVGFGLNANVSSGPFEGNNFAVEWLQPVEDHVNGYQQERRGALSATWSVAF